jgi:hypothetical protein
MTGAARTGQPVISRQKIVGWVLVIVSVAYIAYFLRVRLFAPGPIIEKKEWVQFIGTFVILMLGTINVRLAAMRERRRKGSPN